MMQHHKYSLTEIENMIPWEREIYTTLLSQWVEQENERNKKMHKKANRKMNFQTVVFCIISGLDTIFKHFRPEYQILRNKSPLL